MLLKTSATSLNHIFYNLADFIPMENQYSERDAENRQD